MDPAKMPEEANERWMNIDHEEQEENFEYNGMILVVSPVGVELQEAFKECRNIGDGGANNDDEEEEDSFDDDEMSGTRDVPLDVAVPVITISEDDISRIYDEPDCYIMREDEKPSAPKGAASHGSFLSRVRGLMGERGRAYKVFVRHGRERFEI